MIGRIVSTLITLALLAIFLTMIAHAGEVQRIPAEFARSQGSADLSLYVGWQSTLPRAYIGACRGGTPSGATTTIFLTSDRIAADMRVRLAERESEADLILCVD